MAMPPAQRATVLVPRVLSIGLCSVLILALVVISFLLGREIGRQERRVTSPRRHRLPIGRVSGAAVATNVNQVEAITSDDVVTGRPETLAMTLQRQAVNGDWSQFDQLGNPQWAMRKRFRRLHVSEACLLYHEKMVSLLETSSSLLHGVRQGVGAGNLAALSTLATIERPILGARKKKIPNPSTSRPTVSSSPPCDRGNTSPNPTVIIVMTVM